MRLHHLVTGGGNLPPRLMDTDGYLTAESGSADGSDGYDGFLEKLPTNIVDVVVAQQQQQLPYREFLAKDDKKGQNGYNPSAPSTLAVSHPSGIHQHPSNPSAPSTPAISQLSHLSPEPLSAAARSTITAQSPLETSQLPSNEVDNVKNRPISTCQDFKVGDFVVYCGLNKMLQKQYAGVLQIHQIHSNGEYTCMKPCGTSLTSWIKEEELNLVKK